MKMRGYNQKQTFNNLVTLYYVHKHKKVSESSSNRLSLLQRVSAFVTRVL